MTFILICSPYLQGHSRTITGVWGALEVWETVAEEVWKLLLNHCSYLQTGLGEASDSMTDFYTVTDLPGLAQFMETQIQA